MKNCTTAQYHLKIALLLTLLVTALKVLFITSFTIRELSMTPWLIDDSFIMMQVSRNFALGLGYSFDGISRTSGVPPLWPILTSPLHAFLSRDTAALTTVAFGALVTTGSSLLLFLLAARLYGIGAAWISFTLSLLSAPILFNSFNGMETGLFGLIGVCIAWYALRLYLDHRGSTIILGALLGLEVLCRVDGIFLAFSVICVGLFPYHTKPLELIKNSCSLALPLAMVSLPAFLWSWYVNATVMPANQSGRKALAWINVIGSDGTADIPRYLMRVLSHLFQLHTLLSCTLGLSLLVLLSLWHACRTKPKVYFVILAGYIFPFFGALVLYQGYFPDVHGLRYLHLPTLLVLPPLAARLIDLVGPRRGAREILCGITCIILFFTFYHYTALVRRLDWAKELRILPLYSQQEVKMYWSFNDWIQNKLPEGSSIAAKDHGRLAYFTGAKVTDLAGIIEPPLQVSFQAGNIAEYLHKKGVKYVLLPPQGGYPIHEAVRAGLQLQEVVEAPLQEGTRYRLYRVNGR